MISRTERLLLREFSLDDWPAVLAYHRDPRYLRFYPDEHGTEPEVRKLVRMFVDWQAEAPRQRFQWAVVLPGDGRIVGNCGVRMRSAEEGEADIVFELHPDHWGKGYATELARALLCFGFNGLGLRRVSAQCVAENEASAHVLDKVGMRREGRLERHFRMKGRWWDTLLYGILRSEWETMTD